MNTNPPIGVLRGPDGGGEGKVGSRRERSQGSELEGEKILLGRKFSYRTAKPPPITLTHPELIRNQQQSVRCIKGRSG
jgi:hypothetical protein